MRTPSGWTVVQAFLLLSFSSAVQAAGSSVTVATYSELQSALAKANSSGGNTAILLQDGTYTLTDSMLAVSGQNISISSVSGNRDRVILQGDAMSESANVKIIFRVTAAAFNLSNVTLRRVGWHLVQLVGESGGTSPVFRNVVFRDSYQQLFKGSVASDGNGLAIGSTADSGLVENCLFEYTAGIGPNYYIGGIDVHGGKNWIVRANTFRNIISPGGSVAEFAVHFWNRSSSNLVERNLIINSDRGIGFGLSNRGNTAGIIRNNMIYHAAGKGGFADTGIYIEDSPNTQIYNNTIFFEHSYPNAIESRFSPSSGGLIENNLTNRAIALRDGATGTVVRNVVNALASWFVGAALGDLHLAVGFSSTAVLGQGLAIGGLSNDFDGQSRSAVPVDIGADQLVGSAGTVPAPKNLRIQ